MSAPVTPLKRIIKLQSPGSDIMKEKTLKRVKFSDETPEPPKKKVKIEDNNDAPVAVSTDMCLKKQKRQSSEGESVMKRKKKDKSATTEIRKKKQKRLLNEGELVAKRTEKDNSVSSEINKKKKKKKQKRLTNEGEPVAKRTKKDKNASSEISMKKQKTRSDEGESVVKISENDGEMIIKNGPSTSDGVEIKNSLLEKKKKSLKILEGTAGKPKSLKMKGKSKKTVLEKRPEDSEASSDVKTQKLVEMKWKDRKEVRKSSSKNNYVLIKKTKSMWGELRRKNLEQSKRFEICGELANLLRGRAKEMIFAHDTCRVVQCLMQYGNEDQRTMLFEELKEFIPELTKSKYSKFFIRKIMKYGKKEQKNLVFNAYHGKVRKLIRHTEAAQILELCYNDYANAQQRSSMVEEFYGPSYALFKTDKIRTLEQIMTSEPLKKESILSNMKEALVPLIDKNILLYSLVHRIFSEFFSYASPKMRTEMIELLRDHLVPMMHTRDGTRVAMACVWHGTTKDRKVIIKSLKGHVVKLCKEEHGHYVLLAIFDSVDDTKIVQKVIVDELVKSLGEVVDDTYGRRVLHYLIKRRDARHFHPSVIQILAQGDGNATSKKEAAVRSQELLDYISPHLYSHVINNAIKMLEQNTTLLLLLDVINYGSGDCTAAMRAVVEVVADAYPGANPESHFLVSPAGHMVVKRLLQQDKDRVQRRQHGLFSLLLLEALEGDALHTLISSNRGCFTVVCMLEVGSDDVTKIIAKELKVKKSLTALKFNFPFKGAKVLLKKLKSL